MKLVQTGEGWLAPIEKSRTLWKGGLVALGLVLLSWTRPFLVLWLLSIPTCPRLLGNG